MATTKFTGAIDALWSKAGNWDHGVPVAYVNGTEYSTADTDGHVVTLDAATAAGVTIKDNNVSPGSVVISGAITLANPLKLEGVLTVSSGGFLNVNSSGSLTVSSGGFLNVNSSGSLTVDGTLTVNSGGTLYTDGTLNVNSYGTLNVNSSGTLTVNGTLTVDGTLTVSILATFSIDGTATCSAGSFLTLMGIGPITVADSPLTIATGNYGLPAIVATQTDLSAANILAGKTILGVAGSQPTTATTQAATQLADYNQLEPHKAALLATKTITFGVQSVTGTLPQAKVMAANGGSIAVTDVLSTGTGVGAGGTYVPPVVGQVLIPAQGGTAYGAASAISGTLTFANTQYVLSNAPNYGIAGTGGAKTATIPATTSVSVDVKYGVNGTGSTGTAVLQASDMLAGLADWTDLVTTLNSMIETVP